MACRLSSSCLTQVTFARLGMASHSHPPSPKVADDRPQTSHGCPLGPASCHALTLLGICHQDLSGKSRGLAWVPSPASPGRTAEVGKSSRNNSNPGGPRPVLGSALWFMECRYVVSHSHGSRGDLASGQPHSVALERPGHVQGPSCFPEPSFPWCSGHHSSFLGALLGRSGNQVKFVQVPGGTRHTGHSGFTCASVHRARVWPRWCWVCRLRRRVARYSLGAF